MVRTGCVRCFRISTASVEHAHKPYRSQRWAVALVIQALTYHCRAGNLQYDTRPSCDFWFASSLRGIGNDVGNKATMRQGEIRKNHLNGGTTINCKKQATGGLFQQIEDYSALQPVIQTCRPHLRKGPRKHGEGSAAGKGWGDSSSESVAAQYCESLEHDLQVKNLLDVLPPSGSRTYSDVLSRGSLLSPWCL